MPRAATMIGNVAAIIVIARQIRVRPRPYRARDHQLQRKVRRQSLRHWRTGSLREAERNIQDPVPAPMTGIAPVGDAAHDRPIPVPEAKGRSASGAM
nr:hypothetical protein [Nitrosomonas nitrosa]